MKTFETPIVDVKKFDVMDVLTVSGGEAETTEEAPPDFGRMVGSNCAG